MATCPNRPVNETPQARPGDGCRKGGAVMTPRTYQTKMRVLPDGEWQGVTVTEYAGFADLPWFKDLPTIPADEFVHLNDLTPAQFKRLKTMTAAELKALAKRQAKARGEAVRS